MSACKISSNLQSLTEMDITILNRAKQVANEVNSFSSNTDLLGLVSPLECIAQNIEEITVLKEMRNSKYNTQVKKIKLLKGKMNRTFKN